jgi:hypothetical protein
MLGGWPGGASCRTPGPRKSFIRPECALPSVPSMRLRRSALDLDFGGVGLEVLALDTLQNLATRPDELDEPLVHWPLLTVGVPRAGSPPRRWR